MVGDLKKVQEAIRRLKSLVDEAVEANRFYGMKAESAVLECLGDGEWQSISRVQQALHQGGLTLGLVPLQRRCGSRQDTDALRESGGPRGCKGAVSFIGGRREDRLSERGRDGRQ